jgi:hypothetical protein
MLLLLQLLVDAPQPLLMLMLKGIVLRMHVGLQMLLPGHSLIFQVLPAVQAVHRTQTPGAVTWYGKQARLLSAHTVHDGLCCKMVLPPVKQTKLYLPA